MLRLPPSFSFAALYVWGGIRLSQVNIDMERTCHEHVVSLAKKPAWLSNLNIALDIQNLFDSYRHVTLVGGSAAPGYERYEVDPLGRTIQLSLRKRF